MGYARGMSGLDMNALMQQAMQMQQQMQAMQAELKTKEVEGSAVGGRVKVIVTGDLRVKKVTIDPSLLTEDSDMLEDLVLTATNKALEQAQGLAQNQMAGLLPPGLMPGGFPGL